MFVVVGRQRNVTRLSHTGQLSRLQCVRYVALLLILRLTYSSELLTVLKSVKGGKVHTHF